MKTQLKVRKKNNPKHKIMRNLCSKFLLAKKKLLSQIISGLENIEKYIRKKKIKLQEKYLQLKKSPTIYIYMNEIKPSLQES